MRPTLPSMLAASVLLLGCPSDPPPVVAPPPPLPVPASLPEEPPPVQARPPEAIIGVAVYWEHSCVVRQAGTVHCWGKNSYGQLGLGHRDKTPGTAAGSGKISDDIAAVAGIDDAVAVATGRDFSCALRRAGRVVCWGNNEDGQLGDGRGVEPGALNLAVVDVGGLTGVTQLSAGEYHACALDGDGRVSCWGNAGNGQIGSDAARGFGTPRTIEQLKRVRELASGASHVCALERNGKVKCWGRNTEGQLGDGKSGSRISPVFVKGIDDAVHLASGFDHSCALRRGGAVSCWGDNKSRQLGPEAAGAPKRDTPVDVPGLGEVERLAGGAQHTCARLRSGAVRCWGGNDKGQLGGQQSDQPQPQPVDVPGVAEAVALSLGKTVSCVALGSGEASCWGALQP